MPWDRAWLSFFRAAGAFARAFPLTSWQVARAEERGQTGLLSPLAAKRPLLAAVLVVPILAVPMMLLFDVLSWFRHPLAMAVLWLIAAGFVGLAMGWYWSFTKRMGQPPTIR